MCACTCCKCVSSKTAYSPRHSSSISAAMQYSSESLKQQPELPYTHTGKLTNTHTTAVKCHANTFYRPPLTSLIRTLHFKVEAEKKKKRKQICLQGLTAACTMEALLAGRDFIPAAFSFLFWYNVPCFSVAYSLLTACFHLTVPTWCLAGLD